MGQIYFISRAGKDSDFARWLAQELEADGHRTILQDNNFGHADFMARMHEAFVEVDAGAQVIALYSEPWFASEYCLKEGMFPLTSDPFNKNERLVPLRIEAVSPGGQFKGVAYTDLLPVRQRSGASEVRGEIWRALGLSPKGAAVYPIPKYAGVFLHPAIRHNPTFAGREDVLDRIGQTLRPDRPLALTNAPAAQAIAGMGGVGKSELAREFACRGVSNYAGVWWLRAERKDDLAADLIAAAAHIEAGIAVIPDRDAAVRQAVGVFEAQLTPKPWLLIYDNAEHPDAIREFIPRAGAHALITTRWEDWHSVASVEDVTVFPPEVAVRYLLDNSKRADEAGAKVLAERLGYLPLALSQAAAYLRQTPSMSIAKYVEHASALLKKGAVYATFTLALERLEKGGDGIEPKPEAAFLMGLLSFMAPDAIPLFLFEALEPLAGPNLHEAAAALSAVSLAEASQLDDGQPALSVHRLVQEVMRGRLVASGDHDSALGLALNIVAKAFPLNSDDVRTWPDCDDLAAHAVAVSTIAPDSADDAEALAKILGGLGLLYQARAQYAAAEVCCRRALKVAEARFGPHQAEVAQRLNNLSSLLQATGRYEEAEAHMRRAQEMIEAEFGAVHPFVAIGLNNLATLLDATGRKQEAGQVIRRAIQIEEEAHGPSHPNLAILLINLAQFLDDEGQTEEAGSVAQRALSIAEASFGPDHPEVASALIALAIFFGRLDRVAEAEPLMRRAQRILVDTLGHDHPRSQAVSFAVARAEKFFMFLRAARTPGTE